MSAVYETPASPRPAATPARHRPGANGRACNEACGWSRKPLTECRCLCGGARHGSFNASPAQIALARARTSSRIAAAGDPFLGGGADLDEGAF